ncbi:MULTISPECIES: hypothetical protein [Flavobacterium]|uniref:Uncharacterized protein n=1 Tax=Flavobacterium xinjiangense TaxID=178356 RepID=A0A1M7DJG5_9FLAO|nr:MULTISPECIES: hypothetical protein [Flavobacterium]MDI5896979.1 hypothetical protein [Flavobacterium yafengii]SHL79503.1 hypothetical protein SAMN05216269_101135 [Flavobacterium xinjiangense]
METTKLTRKELYDLVWSTTISKILEQFALSNDGFKKICKKYEIPLPPNGYWLKLKHNKPFKKEILNLDFNGDNEIEFTIREEGSIINIDQSPLTILTKQILSDKNAPLSIPEKLTKPDVLIAQTKDSKNNYDFYSYRTSKIDLLSIYVEKDNFNRALIIMDMFVKLLRYRGHSFKRDINGDGPHIMIKEISFPFSIREAKKRIPPEKNSYGSTYIPTGILVIKIGESYKAQEWKDGTIKLENQLAKIVAKLEIDAEKELIRQEESRIYWLKYEEEKERKNQIKRRKDEEIQKFNKLVELSKQYNQSLLIREYIKAEYERAVDKNNLTPEKIEWIKWANDKADWLDPLINKTDDILDGE